MSQVIATNPVWHEANDSLLEADETPPTGADPNPRDVSTAPARLLACGIAFVFLYAATTTFVNPSTYRSYLPTLLDGLTPSTADFLLRAFAVCEVALAAGVLIRRYRYPASLLSAATLVGIVGINGEAFEILFRNVAIAFGALALAQLSNDDRRQSGGRTRNAIGPLDGGGRKASQLGTAQSLMAARGRVTRSSQLRSRKGLLMKASVANPTRTV